MVRREGHLSDRDSTVEAAGSSRELRGFVLRHRRRKQVSLNTCPSQRREGSKLRLRLDAFDNAIQSHVSTECQQGFDDLVAGRSRIQVLDEAAIDLEFCKR